MKPDFEMAARACLDGTPGVEFGIVLGSGLTVLDDLADRRDTPYGAIPGLPQTTVEGHQGIMSVGRIPDGPRVAIARGRFHVYEGHVIESATYLVRLFKALGAHSVVLTNAAGGLRDDWAPGDLMLMDDHLNFTGQTLMGPSGAPPDRSVYDPQWRAETVFAATALEIELRRGCYVGLLGPTYETAAEIRYLVRAGADAVGMSTVLEAPVALWVGLRVLAISCITNVAVTTKGMAETSHHEVVDVARQASSRLDRLLRAICRGR